MTIEEIKNDLKNIRYYYSRRNTLDKSLNDIGVTEVLKKIEKYNQLICGAPARLIDIYYSLYHENNTQDSLACKLGYTPAYVYRLNKKLIDYLYAKSDKLAI